MKVTRAQAKPILERTFPNYNGRKVSVEFTDTVEFYDLNWDGGTCNQYAAVSTDGASRSFEGFNAAAPWNNPYEGAKVGLPENVAVVRHSDFCGHDCGITIYLHPANAPKWLASGS